MADNSPTESEFKMAWYDNLFNFLDNALDKADKAIMNIIRESILGKLDKSLSQAQKDLIGEIAVTIAYGAVPGIGQVIDGWYTIDAALNLIDKDGKKNSTNPNFQFDFVVALMGWVPMLGDGAKATLKTVNKKPEVYGPIMFSTMSYAFNAAGDNEYVQAAAKRMGFDVKQLKYINPEALLDKYTSSDFVQKQFKAAQANIKSSKAYRALPYSAQVGVDEVFNFAKSNLPSWINVVHERLVDWRPKPPKSTHQNGQVLASNTSKNQPTQVGKTQTQGANNPAQGNSKTKSFTKKLTKPVTGVVGEHMADYYMSGKHSDGGVHDQGERKSAKKVSHEKKLKMLVSNPTGVGIDALWKDVDEPNTLLNEKKGYCIVEAKASILPGIKYLTHLLSVTKDPTAPKGRLVQMSKLWCLRKAKLIDDDLAIILQIQGYSRRVFFYNSVTIAEHLLALGEVWSGQKTIGQAEPTHNHAASRQHHPTKIFTDKEIEAAVTQRENPNNKDNNDIKEADIPQ
jgi:hypothetical protein